MRRSLIIAAAAIVVLAGSFTAPRAARADVYIGVPGIGIIIGGGHYHGRYYDRGPRYYDYGPRYKRRHYYRDYQPRRHWGPRRHWKRRAWRRHHRRWRRHRW